MKPTSENFNANVAALALAVHQRMMLNAIAGIYTPISICGITVTCADDCRSVTNRFFDKMRSVDYSDIDSAMAEYGL